MRRCCALLLLLLFAPLALGQGGPGGRARPRVDSPSSGLLEVGALSRELVVAPAAGNDTDAPSSAEQVFPACANGLPEVRCLVDPCALALCPRRLVCQSDYCGGCYARCVDPATGLAPGEEDTTTASTNASSSAGAAGDPSGAGSQQAATCLTTRQVCNCSTDCCGSAICISYRDINDQGPDQQQQQQAGSAGSAGSAGNGAGAGSRSAAAAAAGGGGGAGAGQAGAGSGAEPAGPSGENLEGNLEDDLDDVLEDVAGEVVFPPLLRGLPIVNGSSNGTGVCLSVRVASSILLRLRLSSSPGGGALVGHGC